MPVPFYQNSLHSQTSWVALTWIPNLQLLKTKPGTPLLGLSSVTPHGKAINTSSWQIQLVRISYWLCFQGVCVLSHFLHLHYWPCTLSCYHLSSELLPKPPNCSPASTSSSWLQHRPRTAGARIERESMWGMAVYLRNIVFMSAEYDLTLDGGAGCKTFPILQMTSLSMSNWWMKRNWHLQKAFEKIFKRPSGIWDFTLFVET